MGKQLIADNYFNKKSGNVGKEFKNTNIEKDFTLS